MSQQPLIGILIDDVNAVLKRYSGQGVTYAEVIGALELIKSDIISGMRAAGDVWYVDSPDDDPAPDPILDDDL